ncbi:hypothetical protein DB354_01095 [Opitutus sp. ER46]|nr:hypothetical protein DB354_01095 [Opitutus sp. ER46]
MTTTGSYCTGEDLTPWPATLAVEGEGRLQIRWAQGERVVPLAELRVSDRLANIPRFIYLPGGAVVETADNGAIDALLVTQRRGRFAAVVHALESHHGVATVACVVLVALLVASFFWVPPRLARSIAGRVPPAIEVRAGAAAKATLAQYFTPFAPDLAERARVERQLIRIQPDGRTTPRPTIEFWRFTQSPNAFALPGNVIVLNQELLELSLTDDELAALLAHELGHLRLRHGIQSVLRNSFALLIVSAATGDLSALGAFTTSLPVALLQNGYSRDLEREADAFAYDLLRERRIPTKAFSSLLVKLGNRAPAEAAFSYLSTHPATEERIARFGVLTAEERQRLVAAPPQAKADSDARAATSKGKRASVSTGLERNCQPVALFRTEPVYPLSLRVKGETGEVLVDFVVDADGDVKNAFVIRSTNRAFNEPALAAVQTWKFSPGRRDYRAVAVHMQVPVVFTLDEDDAPPVLLSPPVAK